MKKSRSILEQINANRQRRTPPSLDDLNRTLQSLEKQLQERLEPSAEETRPAASEPSFGKAPQRSAPASPRETRNAPARQATAGNGVKGNDERSGLSAIAVELQELRDELRKEMSTGVRKELENLGRDMARLRETIAEDGYSSHIADELGRISEGVQALAHKTSSEDLAVLREDLEELKQTVQTLAREETVSRLDNRWDSLDRRFDQIESRYSTAEQSDSQPNGAIETRLDEMRSAIDALPDSTSLRGLEDKVKLLAGAIEHLTRQRSQTASAEVVGQIEERLDEISRAIAASGRTAAQSIDPGAIERIEARVTALAGRFDELPAEFRTDVMLERIGELGHRMESLVARHENSDHRIDDLAGQVQGIARQLAEAPTADTLSERMSDFGKRIDEIASRYDTSEDHVSRLAEQMSVIAQHLESTPAAAGTGDLSRLEERIEEVARKLDEFGNRPQIQDKALIEAVDRRFEELSQRLDSHVATQPAQDTAFIEGLEARLDEISRRLAENSSRPAPVDNEAIRNLEAQIAGLTQHLSTSTALSPSFAEIAPRLASIEETIATGHDAVLEVARKAADEAVRRATSGGMGGSAADAEVITGLSDDLKSLEKLARQSDTRNTKTFEAIHETLLKIVERLGTLEEDVSERRPDKAVITEAPSLEFDDEITERQVEPVTADAPPEKTPSSPEVMATVPTPAGNAAPEAGEKRGSLLKGLSQAVKKRGKGKAEADKASEPSFEEPVSEETASADVDPAAANRPLEPGSGVPDLNSIMRRVREERREKGGSAREDSGKSDFIAAARRAAQAAAAEADLLKDEPGDGDGKSRFAAGDLLRRQRKPILMAVAAVIVAMAAIQVKNAFFATSETPVAVRTTPPADTIKSAETQSEAKPVRKAEQTKPSTQPKENSAPAADMKTADKTGPAKPQATGKTATPPTTTADNAATPPTPAAQDQAAATPSAATEAAPAAKAGQDTHNVQTAASQTAASPTTASAGTTEASAPQTATPIVVPDSISPTALREAAASGDPMALFEVGNRYSEGEGVSSNTAEAAKWYRKAAELGFAPAEYRLGNIYEKGLGVKRDVSKAKIWYEKAADQGNATAMHNLAVLLAMGVDGPADNKAAARWFTKAAELGVKDSQYNLGIMAAKGLGMSQNFEASYKWFALAAKQGDEDAAKKRDQVAKVMKPDQLKQARGTVELWKPKPLVTAANSVDIPDAWRNNVVSKTAAVDMKKAVANIQRILAKNGYNPGPPDGVMGQNTRDAIAAFQKDHGMKPTGKVDQALVKALLENK